MLACVFTYPYIVNFSNAGRLDTNDGRWSIWVVSWVAHALTTHPFAVFDANIFYPHRNALAFSEANIGAGVIATPAYWLTRSLTRLTKASESLAGGDLNVRLPAGGGDEVGKLTHAFNAMAAALQGRLKALAESATKFTAIADYSYDCELWISQEGKLIWINPRVLDMFGYTPEECLATENFPAPFISEPDVARTVRQVRRALRGNSGADYEFRARRKDGSEYIEEQTITSVRDGGGAVTHFIGVKQDMTERNRAESELTERAKTAHLAAAEAIRRAGKPRLERCVYEKQGTNDPFARVLPWRWEESVIQKRSHSY